MADSTKPAARLSSQQLFSLQDAVRLAIANHERQHWFMVGLMGRDAKETLHQNKMIDRLNERISLMTDAIRTVERMYEAQFDSREELVSAYNEGLRQ